MIATAPIARMHRWVLSILLVLLVTQESLSLKLLKSMRNNRVNLFRRPAIAIKTGDNGAQSIEFEVAGQIMSLETGKIGRQADGAVVARSGDTIVYSTACYQKEESEVDFTPLRVDYFARFSSAGKTIGSFSKRDSRGDDHETLVARLIDRPIRPIIDDGWRFDTQILTWVLSYDHAHPPEPLAICAASAALAISDIPLVRPIAGVEVGLINGSFVINPPKSHAASSDLSLILAGTTEDILMIEGAAQFLTEDQLLAAIDIGHQAIRQICEAIETFAQQVGKAKKTELLHRLPSSLVDEMDALFGAALMKALATHDKQRRGIAVSAIEADIEQHFAVTSPSRRRPDEPLCRTDIEGLDGEASALGDEEPVSEPESDDTVTTDDTASTMDIVASVSSTSDEDEASEIVHPPHRSSSSKPLPTVAGYEAMEVKKAIKKLMGRKLRDLVQSTGRRADGRRVDEVRPLSMETSWLPGTHGSALFTRGETQAIATATLGGESMAAFTETLDGATNRRFYLQYRFPPSSVGEVGRVGGAVSRREVGHGHLAERALLPVIPDVNVFPYTIRGESLITESSGSSSMATVCGVSLAMLDAGVPLQRSIAGIAMGMLLPDDTRGDRDGDKGTAAAAVAAAAAAAPIILTDILGLEDALGSMDFKVAGDESGITAFQLDVKCAGLRLSTLRSALLQAKQGRIHILRQMQQHLAQPRALNVRVPKLKRFMVPTEMLGKIIGPRGRTIQSLMETYAVEDIHVDDSGAIQIIANDQSKVDAVERAILDLIGDSAPSPSSAGSSGSSSGSDPDGRGSSFNGEKRGGTAIPHRVVDKGPPPEAGMIYRQCPITGVHPFGVFVEIAPGYEGLVHISELGLRRIGSMEEEGYEVGQLIDVKYVGVNDRGQRRLSRRAVLLADSVPGA